MASHLAARQARYELAQLTTTRALCWCPRSCGTGQLGGALAKCISRLPQRHPKGEFYVRWQVANLAVLAACVFLTPLRLAYSYTAPRYSASISASIFAQ